MVVGSDTQAAKRLLSDLAVPTTLQSLFTIGGEAVGVDDGDGVTVRGVKLLVKMSRCEDMQM